MEVNRANQALVDRLARIYTYSGALAERTGMVQPSLTRSSSSSSSSALSTATGTNQPPTTFSTSSSRARVRALRAEAIDVANFHLSTRLLKVTGQFSDDEMRKRFARHQQYVKRLSKAKGMRFSIDLSGDISTPEAAQLVC